MLRVSGFWGLFWDRLGRLCAVLRFLLPKNGLRVPQKRSKISPRARLKKKNTLSLQRGPDFEALRTHRNSRNPERTRAKMLFYRVAHSAGPSRVCWVLSSKKIKEVSWANILDDVDKALYAWFCLASIETPTAELCVLCCLCLVGSCWSPFEGILCPCGASQKKCFRSCYFIFGPHWGQLWANFA
jgi:hypothetical protein